MKKTKIILAILLLMACNSMNAQIFTSVIDEQALEFRVKQIDEFMKRFNYEVDYRGELPKDRLNKEERKKNMMTLLNLDKFFDNNKQLDSISSAFIDEVIGKDLSVYYEDTTWTAFAKGKIMYEGKAHDVTYSLKTEKIKNVMYKWVINDIQSPIFGKYRQEQEGKITISPASHGTNFISLPETFNLNSKVVGTSFSKDYHRNTLAVFDFLFFTGKIKAISITNVKFNFIVGNYEITIERIEKNKGNNQGWLINDIKRR